MIHKSSIIHQDANVSEKSEIGPYVVIGPNVKIGENVIVHSHVNISGDTTIGDGSKIFPFASIGNDPQDLKYKGEKTKLVIGKNNTIREYVTINPGTDRGGGTTVIGNNCLFMISSHIAHDCKIGNNVVIANNVPIGGHGIIEDDVIIGGNAAVHQFTRIGEASMIGGLTGVLNDVIPYGSVKGNRAFIVGLNVIGLKRRGVPREVIHSLRRAYRLLFAQEGTLAERVEDVAKMFLDNEPVMEIVSFIRKDSSRSVCQPEIEHAA